MSMHLGVLVEIRTDGCAPLNTDARHGLRASARTLCATQYRAITPAPKQFLNSQLSDFY